MKLLAAFLAVLPLVVGYTPCRCAAEARCAEWNGSADPSRRGLGDCCSSEADSHAASSEPIPLGCCCGTKRGPDSFLNAADGAVLRSTPPASDVPVLEATLTPRIAPALLDNPLHRSAGPPVSRSGPLPFSSLRSVLRI